MDKRTGDGQERERKSGKKHAETANYSKRLRKKRQETSRTEYIFLGEGRNRLYGGGRRGEGMGEKGVMEKGRGDECGIERERGKGGGNGMGRSGQTRRGGDETRGRSDERDATRMDNRARIDRTQMDRWGHAEDTYYSKQLRIKRQAGSWTGADYFMFGGWCFGFYKPWLW